MRKIFQILLTILTISTTCMPVSVFAAPGSRQKLEYTNKDDGVPIFQAIEDGEKFYVYCFSSDLYWPDRPDSDSGHTLEYYVPDDFLHLDNYNVDVEGTQVPVKDMIHKIFYAGFPHNNAGLYVESDNYVPTVAEMTRGLNFDPDILDTFPELKNGVFTYNGDGTGTLDTFNTPEAQTFISIGEKLEYWAYVGTTEEKELVKRLVIEHRYFFSFAYAYSKVYENGADLENDLPDIYVSSLGALGMSATKEEAHSATQYAIWIILNRAGVPYNSKKLDEVNLEGSLVRRLVDFAYDLSAKVPKRNYNQSDLETYKNNFNSGKYLLKYNSDGTTAPVNNNGDIKFFYNPADGKYYSEKLKFYITAENESAYISHYDINVIGEHDEVLTTVTQYNGDDFVLVVDKLPTQTKVSISSDNYWPSPIYQYVAESDKDKAVKKYQEMSGVKYEKVELEFSANAVNYNEDLIIKKQVTNKTAASGEDFWFNAKIDIKNIYNQQVSGWLNYTKYKIKETGDLDYDTGIDGTVYNYGATEDGGYNTKFSLKEGEAIVIHDLPIDTNYKVVEYGLKENDTSMSESWTPSYKVNNTESALAAGTINSVKNEVDVLNTYKFQPVSVSIKGTKTLKNRSDSELRVFPKLDGEEIKFSFILWPDVHGNPMPSGSEYDSETLRYKKIVTNSAQNTTSKNAEFDFGTISFDKAGTYSYTIEEQQVTYDNITKDPRHYDVQIVVTENGGSLEKTVTVSRHNTDHSLVDTSQTVTDDSPIIVEFENKYSNSVVEKEIRVKKTVANNSSNENISRKDYQFKIEPKNNENLDKYPDLSTGSKSCTVITGDSGEAISPNIEFTDSWFNTYDADHNNVIELEYKITEVPGSLGYIKYSDEVAYATITITKKPGDTEENTSYSSVIKYSYGNHTDIETPPVFTNAYQASGSLNISAAKEIVSTLSIYTPAAEEKYTISINDDFERNGDKSGYVLPTNKKFDIKYNGSTFSAVNNVIKFSKAGNYRFELSEDIGNVKDIIYDTNKWILDVNVADQKDGTLSITSEYFSESAPLGAETSAKFVNNHKPTVYADLNLSKELLGRDLKDNDQFKIIISHSIDEANPCTPSHSHDNISHPVSALLYKDDNYHLELSDAVKIHDVNHYYVIAKEEVPSYTNMKYDTTNYVMEIKTEQNGNDLIISDGYPKYFKVSNSTSWDSRVDATSDFKFTNKTTELSIQKKIELLSSRYDYEFELTLLESDNTPLANKTFVTSIGNNNNLLFTDENGKATFKIKANETLSILDLSDGTKYEVRESNIPESTTKIVVVENNQEKTPVDGKTVSGTLEAGVREMLVVKNKGKGRPNGSTEEINNPNGDDKSYIAPNTSAK